MTSRSLGQRAPLLWLVLPLIGGLVAGRVSGPGSPTWFIWPGLTAALAATALAWRGTSSKWAWIASMVVALWCAGMASYRLERRRMSSWESLPPREVRVAIGITRTFSAADPRRVSGLGTITRVEGPAGELVGQRIYFSCSRRPGDPSPARSAVLTLSGVLSPLPSDPPAESFEAYLSSSGVNFRLNRGRFLAVEQPQRRYYRFCDEAAAKFNEILGLGIAAKRPALAGLLRAMMLGETRDLTNEQHKLFMQSGTMHLFAISGLNIAVIATSIQALLAAGGLGPWPRFLIGAPLLWLFVDITGAAPSAIRAFATAVFFQAAFVTRRPANALAAITGTTAIVLVVSPLQLFSASFIMSYAVVLALLLVGVPLSEAWMNSTALWRDLPKATWKRWQRWTDVSWRWFVGAVAVGVATALVGMITGVQYFQLLTPGALVSNLVLIPAAVLVTVGGFASVLCGLCGCAPGAVLCNHASAVVLLAIETFVRWSVRVPGAFVAAHFRASWIGGAALLLLTASMFVGYHGRWERSCGGWWPPFVIVALTLVAGVSFG